MKCVLPLVSLFLLSASSRIVDKCTLDPSSVPSIEVLVDYQHQLLNWISVEPNSKIEVMQTTELNQTNSQKIVFKFSKGEGGSMFLGLQYFNNSNTVEIENIYQSGSVNRVLRFFGLTWDNKTVDCSDKRDTFSNSNFQFLKISKIYLCLNIPYFQVKLKIHLMFF